MRIWLLAVGRFKTGPHRLLWEHYSSRLAEPPRLREVDDRNPGSGRADREGALLLSALPRGAVAVVLDEAGVVLGSVAFARRLADWRDAAVTDLAFVIGGADGHAPAVRQRADLLLSLGPMTWPHLLVRGMLAEQLYRAQQIAAGHPYHRA